MKRADSSGAQIALLLGEDELNEHSLSVRELRGEGGQVRVPQAQIVEHLRARFS